MTENVSDYEPNEFVEEGKGNNNCCNSCCSPCCSKRRIHVIFMLFLLMVIIYGQRTELGLAMIKINEKSQWREFKIANYSKHYNSTQKAVEDIIRNKLPRQSKFESVYDLRLNRPKDRNHTQNRTLFADIEYETQRWSSFLVGFIECAFYMGYMIFSIPSGIIANTWSPKKLLSITIGTTCSLNVLLPLLVKGGEWKHGMAERDLNPNFSFSMAFTVRLFQGMAEGSLYAAVHSLVSFWSPVSERSRMVAVVFLGTSLGPIIGFPLIGYLIHNFTWESVFYLYGTVGLLWTSIWTLFFFDNPNTDIHIEEDELKYIQKTAIKESVTFKNLAMIPWSSILTSKPVWAILVANLGKNWIFQFCFVGIPRFIKDMSILEEKNGGRVWSKKGHPPGLDEEKLGVLMLIPFFFMAIMTPIGGILADFLIQRKTLSVKNTRKFINTLSFTTCACCLVFLGFVKVLWLALVLVTLAIGAVGFGNSGFGANHLDIGPRYTGILMGLSNAFGTMAGIISPIVARNVVKGHDINTWKIFFFICFGVEFCCVIFYLIFASGELQPWATSKHEKD